MNSDQYLARVSQIQSLFQLVFQRQIPAEYLAWRYARNILGLVTVEMLMRDDEVVSHYASTPVEFEFGTKILRGSLVATVMTHPSLRGQGLFQELGERHEQKHRAQGFDFLYAFPNRNSDPIFLRKLGWVAIHDIPMMTLDLADVLQGARPSGEHVFDDNFDRFGDERLLNRAGLFAQRRTQKYMRWRYTDNPTNRYRNLVIGESGDLQAHCVVKTYSIDGAQYLDMVDFFAFDQDAFPSLLAHVVTFAHELGCLGINAWCPRHHPNHQFLMRTGFIAQAPVTYLSAKFLNPNLSVDLCRFTNWWIALGDSDVY